MTYPRGIDRLELKLMDQRAASEQEAELKWLAQDLDDAKIALAPELVRAVERSI